MRPSFTPLPSVQMDDGWSVVVTIRPQGSGSVPTSRNCFVSRIRKPFEALQSVKVATILSREAMTERPRFGKPYEGINWHVLLIQEAPGCPHFRPSITRAMP